MIKKILNELKNFDETTILYSNIGGDKENGLIKEVQHEIPKNNLINFSKDNKIKLNSLFMAGINLTLNKFNFSNKSLIFCSNNIPFACEFENRKITVEEYLHAIDKKFSEILDYADESMDDLLKELNLNPEFYINFDDSIKPSNNYSNHINIHEVDENIIISFFYNNALYTKEFINLFLQSLEIILNKILNCEINKNAISDLALVGEKTDIDFIDVDIPYIHKRFEKQAFENPDSIALVATDGKFTYKELDMQANRIANALIKKGVKPRSNILVMLQRDSNLITAILGILKVGCAFVPIDIDYPQKRIDYIYENSQADYIITNDGANNSLIVSDLVKENNSSSPDIELKPDDLAYMIYTSGSTGNPKGVMISHENIANLFSENPDNIIYNAYKNMKKTLAITTVSFDTFLLDFNALTFGLEVVLANDSEIKNIEELTTLIKKEKPDALTFTTPSRFLQYMEYDKFVGELSGFKYLAVGGEILPKELVSKVVANSDAEIFNIYGPTETTVTCNSISIRDPDKISVGKALHNYVTDIRDIDGKLLPKGVMGELYIGGVGVSKGYYNLDDKTKEVFLTINDIPYYKSGDYAVELSNGEFDIKGRIDNQIKLRGLRIEIGEIEANISKYPHIKQNVVVIKKINNNDHICAYFTSDEEINISDLKEYLNSKLTKYMVPTVFTQIDEMPQTPNGKTDKKQLPEPKLELELIQPENETEKEIFDMVADITKTKEFGTTDDLYAVGFTSLSLMKLNVSIFEKYDLNLNIIEILKEPTIKNIVKQINLNKDESSDLNRLIESSKDIQYYPLTNNQLGIYYECIQSDIEAYYNLPSIIRFDNTVNPEKLKNAIEEVINTYSYLKTRIVSHNGELMQKRDDSLEIEDINIVEIDDISNDEIKRKNVKSFELENNQLFRFKIYKTDSETILFTDIHHIISDGDSLDTLFKNIANAYNGVEIEKESVDGYVNSLIEKEFESSDEFEFSKKYFHEQLTKDIESTILTPNLNGNQDEGNLKSVCKNIYSDKIFKFCADRRISPNVLFMATTILNLNKFTFSDKTLFATIFNGRSNPNYFNTQAFLVKTLPVISVNEDRTLTIEAFLDNVNKDWKDIIKHSNYPYTELSHEFQLQPEFFYSYNNRAEEYVEINGNNYDIEYLETVEANYKINFEVNETKNGLEVNIIYNDQLYSEDYIELFLNCIVSTVNQFINEDISKLRIKDIELESSHDIPTFTPVENPILHERFEKQVELKSDDVALVATDKTFTYSELNIKANRIANALIKKGVEAGSNILIMLPRTSDLIASIIAVLKTGCAFIPIDMDYPRERIDYIFNNSQADYIISNGNVEHSLNIEELLGEDNTSNPGVSVNPDDLAYMIYTSGSTGNPKGVMISHENACNQTDGNPKSEYDNLLSIATIAFDTSLEDILTGITHGIKIIFANDSEIKNIVDLVKLIKENKPEVMEFTPSRLLSYLEIKEFCKVIGCAKCIVMGGEQFSAKAFNGVKKYTDAKVYNSYGPTEATIASNYKEITDSDNITIGKAVLNYVTDVRDIDGKLLPDGVMGELYIGGVGVGKGYYNMDDKTKEVFLTINDIPYYRSGDYAVVLPDGEIDIKGRIDNQIKLRGLRIEIGEIESNISKYPTIKHNVVVIKEINNNDHLCAYFTSDEEIDVDDLKEYLNNRLTKYMVPTVFMQIDEMPQLPNGKTDVKSLPKPVLTLENVKPENETEEKLFNIASEIVDTTEFGTTDDLYAIGFTSLTLMKLNSKIYDELDVNLDISVLFNNPTIKSFAYEILNEDSGVSYLDELKELAKDIEYFPLTENQLGVYYECMQNPDEIRYTLPTVIRFDKSVDAEKLKEAVIDAINAHPYLKTRIVVTEDGSLKQHRNDEINIDAIEIIECGEITDSEIIKNDVRVFKLNDSQLFRFKIYKTSSETVLFSDFHHIITDGVSQINIFDDIGKAYEGKELSQELIDGYVYSLIEKDESNSDKYDFAREFFQEKLNQEIESTVLTPNLNGNAEEGNIRSYKEKIDLKPIEEFCKDNLLSQNALFMSATVLNLNKFTFNDETLITTIFNGRANPNYFNTQGFLVKTLPLIMKHENRQMSVKEFISNVDSVWRDTINNSFYPYTKIAEEYRLKPEFFFSYQEFLESESITINGKSYEEKELTDDSFVANEYKIDLSVFVFNESIELQVNYNDQLYSQDYIKTFVNSINEILNQFINSNIDELRICDVELKSSCEIPTFTPVETPILHERFEKQVELKSDDVALVATDKTFTYSELNIKANRIANALIKKGVEAGSNILIMLPRTSDLIASIIAVLKTGCAFIPIDMDYPRERIDYIFNNSQADYIISDGVIDNSLDVKELLDEENTSNPNVSVNPDDLAYMIYTSGSTGNPKGVMISHENACNQTDGNPKSEYDNLLSIATIAFDTSLEDILTGITHGIKIIFANDSEIKNIVDLVSLIKANQPEVMEFTPSRLLSYLEVSEFCDVIGCAKCIVMGGEQFSAKAFNGVKKYTDAKVYNSYGPTEATIASNYKEITDPDNITIGKAVLNYITDVRDIDGKLLPDGVMGELYIGGVGVGKGYYNMDDKTKEVFLTINDIPYYRSGDYAVVLPDGEIDIKGRIDNQIKLRGLRIEIGEIESNIAKYSGVKRNVVVIKEINNNDHLCAYFTSDEEIDVDDLKEYLNNRLTKYMVPTVFMQIDEMPQLPNGKTDVKSLPKPVLTLENVKPENETEEKLFDIASQIADTTEFGTTDDLYTIGFTSLTLMKLNSLIYEELGVNLEISALFNNPTIKSFADIVLGEDSSSSLDKFIESAKDMEYFPLTENQMGIYYECIQNPYEIKYTMPTVVRFDSDVNADKLKEAVIKTIEAHPYIKTRIVSFEDGSLKQLNNKNAEIDEIEIVELDENITDEEIIFNDVKAFTLGGEQLFIFKIYKTPTETVLFSDFHHIITDGVSQSFIFDDIANAYNGEELSNEIVDGFVYSLIETELSNSEKYDEAREFFNEKLSQEIESTILNPNLNGDEDKGKIKNIVKEIDVNRIDKYCKDNSISKNALFLSATILNLNKYTFRSDSLITTIFNGRANSNYYNTQGFLVKTLPLIIDSSDRQVSIKDFIKNVDKSWKDTINNSYYPYTKIAEEYQLKPEFFYAYHEFDNDGGIVIDGKSYSDYELSDDDLTTGEFKNNLQILDNGNTVNFEISYNDQLYTRDYIETFLDSILLIVDKFMEVNIDSVKISDIELVSDVEVPEFYEVEIPFIHKRFESQVKETPNNTALTACNETLTYSELNKKANRIANALIEKGVKPKSNVLVMLPRDSRLILAIMGILKAGCAYIPIDLEYPQERIDYIYENSQADYIISDETSGNSIDIADLLNNENESNPKVNLLPTDTAYMIYTSGSTGNPKGVMISHRNITNLFTSSKNNLVYNEYLKLNKFLAITTVSFDPFLLDFMALTFGIEIVLANDEEVKNIKELVDLIEREKPDAIPSSTPSRLNQYFEFEGFRNVMHYFKYMCMGGEMMPEDLYDNFSKYTNASIYNAYGPTETTVMSNSKKINNVDKITIGKPLHNYVTDVRDIDGKLLPLGVMGELYIGGVGVGKGYYNMDDKTKEVFLTINDIPYYRSGDYAVALPDGEIDIKGRIDNQIKLRGLRIEIGEIESNIAKYSNIKQCVVVIKEINNNDHLCAYYTADGEIDDNELKEYLKERLTKYMVPTAFMQLDEIPQTPNGKTDTKNLPIPTLKLENVKPENETEEKLFKLASDLINTDQFGTTDDLYALGYTSLILMKLNSMIYEELGVNLDISILFNNPTIKNFAAEIASGSGEDDKLKEIIKSAKDMEYFPLTENQLGIYYECAHNPDEIKYTMPNVFRFDGSIDAEKLKNAIIKAINAHPYLKTRIVTTDGATLKQHKNNGIKIEDIEIVKVNNITDEEIMKNDVKVFQLNDSQLFRFKIYDCNDEIVLFSDFHHIITDGVSQINFFNDVVSIYEGKNIEEEKVDGYTYSLIEKSLESGEKFESAKKFFRDKMGQEIESTVLTPNLNGNPDEGKIKVITDNIDSKIIKKFCKDNLISQNALFMASTILNLNKFTFNSKTLITTISNGRLNPNYERTQGMLVKTLPIITNNENREITIREFIKQVDDTWIDTINNSNYPYTKIAEEYQLKPEFFYAYQEFFESESLKINGTDFDSYALLDDENIVATEYKVDLSINDSETETELQLSFNDQLYTEEYAYKFLHSIKNIINQFINGNIDELRIGDIELETDRQLPQFKPVEIPFIHERFEKQVNIKPDEVALVASDSTLTYSELNQKANRIANALIKKGVTAKSNVLVMLPRTSDLIASLIGVLKAGCAFIPIDMEYPKERIEYIYENSQADYIISDGVIENSLDVKELLKEENNNNINVAMHPDDLAYMIYTSGSTGNPKGVMISHENACNQTDGNPKSEYDNLLSIATIAFDTSLEDILTGITHGIKIIFANDSEIKNIVDLISLIKENKPEVMEFTPSRLLSYLEIKEFCEVIGCAKCIVMGGEQFSAKAFNSVKKYTDAKVYNSYGPTEATIASNYKEITDPDNITIGKALLNYVTEVRDIDGKLLPDGVMGELYIGGTGVGKGYYNMDDKTKEVFTSINNIPYYKSGDYAIELPDGEIDIKGRIDNQIKLRGLRIEIGEIESNISKYPAIKRNVVVIKEINNNDHLCAYFTSDEEIDVDDLKEYLNNRLTKYMVPTVFMQIDEMPQLPNGKTDVKTLPKPVLTLENVKPENETEEKLFKITSELIETDEFGTTDDLYTIGYTSLTLMKLNTLIYKELDVNLEISVLFNNPTIKKLANEIMISGDGESQLDKLIESAKDMKYYPLTENQLGVYYECMQNPDEIMYVIPMITRFGDMVDADKLKEAIINTINAHPYLKTRIVTDDEGILKQYRDDDVEIEDIEIVEVDSIDEDYIMKNDIKAFKLDNDQLFNFKIYKTSNEVVLFSNFHHIITDGESQDALFSDIVDMYGGKDLEEEKVDGYILSLIEKNNEDSDKYNDSRKFFQYKLSQDIESTVLTPNLNGNPDEGKLRGLSESIDSEDIKKFCKEYSVSQNVLLMASAILGLNKFSFTDKALITTIFNGRANPNYYNTQGFLVKTLPLIVTNENREISIKEFLKKIDETWKNTINHSDYPYTKIADEFQLKPEFFYAYQESAYSQDDEDTLEYVSEELASEDAIVTDYKTNLNVVDNGKSIELIVEYNDELYTEDYAQKFLDSILNILNQIISNDIDGFRVCDVELEKNKDIPKFEEIEIPFIHKRFEKQAIENPDKTALIASGKSITYGELNKRANSIANALIKKGVKPKNNVLVMLPRNINLIAAIMGILKAGCAYIPIDMEYPPERIDYIYNNSQADFIISLGNTDNSLNIDELIEEKDTSTPQIDIVPDDLAYMIYTSGSTGNPKGVMISHENIANLFAKSDDNIIYDAYMNMNKTLAITTISFDTFLLDFNALTFGLEVVLANDSEIKNIEELTTLIQKEKPDALTFTTPSRLVQYLEYDKFVDELSRFKYLAVGGEILPKELVSKVVANSDAEIFNIYGPTETTVTCNSISIRDPEKVSVGKALHNYITDVRDIDGKLLPQGVMGELYIGGIGVSKGYYNMDDKTEEVFLTIDNIPYYKSGDYAIELPNGEFDVKGRIDNQIKLRGLRIEIGEIEANIARFPNIRQIVVLIKEINDTEHLCAYFTADEQIDINLLRRYLENKLTKYMIPTVFMQIDEMPQTPNGKTDIKQLPEPELHFNFVQPETKTEKELFEIVKSLSTTEEFGITDDLYSLGFTSLTLMKLNSLIYKKMEVNLDITALFTDPTVKNLADSIDNYMATAIDVDSIIESAKDMGYFPLTDNQLGIYYECMQESTEIKYTMPNAIKFDGIVDPYKLKQAVITAIEAHPYLKTRIVNTDDGELKQRRCDEIPLDDIEIVKSDVDVTPEFIMKNDVHAINLNGEQLFRFKIYKDQNNTWLFSDFHHIITDGVSQENIFKDIAQAYETGNVESEKINGYIYSLIEQENYDNEVSKKYFEHKFENGIESTVLTPNLNGDPDIGKIKFIEDSIDSTFVKHFCNDHAISPNVLFMTATILNLNKFTYSDDALITTIFNGRASSDFYDTQGMLVKTLPIIVNSKNREMMIEDFIKVVDKDWKNALTHSNYPYTKIAEQYQLKPEFFYAYHELFKQDENESDGMNYEVIPLDGTVATDYKVNLNIYNDGENINLYLEYNDELYTEEYIEKFMHGLKYILIQFFVNDMDKFRICDLELENDFAVHEFEEVKNPFLHKRFEIQVDENPNNTALIASDTTLTYKQLEDKSNRIANALIKRGVQPGSKILVMLPRNSNLIAAILGILKSGSAYIPIDLEYPEDRVKYIYENSEADYIIAEKSSETNLGIYDLLKEEDDERPDINISSDNLAYMIYTSGSTGLPKGVMISHKNITNLFAESEDNIIYDAYNEMERTLAITTVSFDTFLLDFNALTFGLEVVLANDSEIKNIEELTNLIHKQKPDALTFTTPSRLIQYLDYDKFTNELSTFKYIAIGGEILPKELVVKVLDNSNAKIFNIYGPTETTVTCNSICIDDPEHLSIGKALHNYVTDVRDIDGKLLPQGVMGELYIGGVGVGKGYYNMDDKTKESFITINQIPYYRSGDYAIELPNGEFDVKGRIDNQIKLRGLRIEIGEIESMISQYPNIKQNVVVIKEINNAEHLCAYFTAEGNIDKNELKEFLKNKLTQYMVPTVFMQIDEMPQTPNGKTDVKQLPEPKIEINYVAPETPLEQLICAVFSTTLEIETVGAEDNFFEIGGTSLIASKLIIELLKREYTVRYDDIFNNQTPRELARFLSGDVDTDDLEMDVIKNYNYDAIHEILEDNTFENFSNGEMGEIGNILLTGVTGFLGIHVLYEYLKNETGTAYCMLRKGKFDSCKDRLVDLMNYYFDEDLTDLIDSRVILSEGDITEINDFKKLSEHPIDTIINCAALVKHFTHDDYIFRVNVDGVINGLKFAQANNAKYIQISTVSVLSPPEDDEIAGDVKFDEKTFYYGQDLSNKYINSKFLAERMVLEEAVNGVHAKIIRVGNLMGRYSDGVFQQNYDTNAFLNNIKAIKNIKAVSNAMSGDEVEMSPIDYVAKIVLALSKTPEECRVFNCQNNNIIHNMDIVNALNTFDYGIKRVSDEEFREICMNNMDENIQGLITSDLSIDEVDDESFEEVVDTNQTAKILHELGLDWPKPDEQYLIKLIKYLNKFNFFTE